MEEVQVEGRTAPRPVLQRVYAHVKPMGASLYEAAIILLASLEKIVVSITLGAGLVVAVLTMTFITIAGMGLWKLLQQK